MRALRNSASKRNFHSGRNGTSTTSTPAGASLAEPAGPITRTCAKRDNSFAICQFSRSIPPTRGGRLRVTSRMRGRAASVIVSVGQRCDLLGNQPDQENDHGGG